MIIFQYLSAPRTRCAADETQGVCGISCRGVPDHEHPVQKISSRLSGLNRDSPFVVTLACRF